VGTLPDGTSRIDPTRAPSRLDPGRAVACLALGAFGLLAALLGRLERLDARVVSWAEAIRGCEGHAAVQTLTDAAPEISAVAVVLAVAVGWRRAPSVAAVLVPLALLGAALLEVQALKLLFERDRPGIPGFQEAGGTSYPSGHVANAALCMVTAGILVLRGVRPAGVRPALVALGVAYVAAVAATRVYLGRHHATDVVGAALLGIAFWAVMQARPLRRPRLVATLVGLQLLGTYLATWAGGRVHLDAPTTYADARPDQPRTLRGYRLARVTNGELNRGVAGRGLRRVHLAGTDLHLTVRDGLDEPAILKMTALPLRPADGSDCAWVDLAVDGRVLVRRPLKQRWRTLAFPLPVLDAGPHTLHLAFTDGERPGGGPRVALRALALETASRSLALAPPMEATRARTVR